MDAIARILVIGGLGLIVMGLFWQFGGKYLPLGKLPGDLTYEKGNMKFSIPLGTSVVLSVVLSLFFWIWSVLRR